MEVNLRPIHVQVRYWNKAFDEALRERADANRVGARWAARSEARKERRRLVDQYIQLATHGAAVAVETNQDGLIVGALNLAHCCVFSRE